jgi:uncharacterized protein
MRRRSLLALGLIAATGRSLATPEEDLLNAALRDDGYRIGVLLLRGVDPNVRDTRGQGALHIALKDDSDKALQSLLKHPGLDVNSANSAGETPLMLAALRGRLDTVQLLVSRGALINREGWTPLHYACSGPDNGVVAWLLGQGAHLDARSPNGSTPLMLAAGYGGLTAAEVLLKAGADPALRNEQGLQAADFAKRAGRDNFAKVLRAAADKR